MKKIVLFVMGLFLIGLPIQTIWQFVLFLIFLAGIILMPVTTNTSRWSVTLLCVALLAGTKMLLPTLQVSEGHQVFFPETKYNVQYPMIPASVYQVMKKQFDALGIHYPASAQTEVHNRFAFSTDGIWQHPRYSRVVSTIQFNSLATFRAGFVNSVTDDLGVMNWYGDAFVPRAQIPYFMMYEISAALVGHQLCWSGYLFLDTKQLPKQSCLVIAPSLRGQKIYGFDFGKSANLSMLLKKQGIDYIWEALSIFLAVVGIFLLCCLVDWSCQERRQFFIYSLVITMFTLLWSAISFALKKEYGGFSGVFVLSGGNDGLVHTGFGRHILHQVTLGHWREALRGYESIFYFMPGMRYCRALLSAVFGESNFASVFIFIYFCQSIFFFCHYLFKKTWLAWFVFIFLLVINDRLFKLTMNGYAELLSYAFFLTALTYLLYNENYLYQKKAIIGSASLFALAVLLRPNLLIGIFFPSIYLIYYWWQSARLKNILFAGIGFFPIGLALLHNFFYGHAIIPFTNSAFIAANFVVSPDMYRTAFYALLHGNWNSAAQTILQQWQQWMGTPWRAICLLATCIILKVTQQRQLQLLALVVLGLHFPFLFWTATQSRYLLLPWLLTYSLVFAAVLEWRHHVQAIRNIRAPQLPQR